MTKQFAFQHKELLDTIRIISNPARFKMLELTEEKEMTITALAKELKLKYTRCSEYVRMMERAGLMNKRKDGKIAYVRSNLILSRLTSSLH